MRKVLILAKREYKASVKTKGFIIGLILAPVFMGGSLIAFVLLQDRVDTSDKRLAIIDRSGVVAEALIEAAEARNHSEVYNDESGRKVKPAYLLEIVDPPSDERDLPIRRLELSGRVESGDLHAYLEIGPDVVHPGSDGAASRITYHAKNAAMDDLRSWMSWPVNNRLRRLRLSDAGIDESAARDLFFWVDVEGMGLVSVDEQTGEVTDARRANEAEALVVPIVMMMLMFLMVMMSVPGMLQSVMEEKTQRIAEVLLGSVEPFEFMMAKVAAGVAVALTSSAVYIVGGILVVTQMGLSEYIPYRVVPWFLVYMLFAIVMLGAMSAALGSTCSEPKDAQSLTFPAILPLILPMFVYFPVVSQPSSGLATWLSLFPTFTPFLMLLRQSTPTGVPVWQPVVGLLGMALFTAAFVWAGGRIFRVAILMHGTPPKLRNIIRWALRG